MLIRTGAIGQERVIRSGKSNAVQSRPPLLVSLALFTVFISTLLTLGVMTAARTQELAQPPILPQAFLPGNRLPAGISCSSDPYQPPCFVKSGDREIYFRANEDTKTITRILIPARDYTIGQLMTIWERPTGITRKSTMVYVHWGTRSALLYTRSFQPDSIVEFILYDLEPLPASPWRGFGLFG